ALWRIAKVGLLGCLRWESGPPVSLSSRLRKQVAGLLLSALPRGITIRRWPLRRRRLCRVLRHRTPSRRPHPALPDPRHVRNPLSRTPSTLRRIATLSHLIGSVYANNRQARGQNLCIGADERKACGGQFPVMRLDKAQMWRFIAFRPLAVES